MSCSTSRNVNRNKTINQEKKDKKMTNGHEEKNYKDEELSSSGDDDEPIRIPTQLKIEFVNSIMFRQWALAKKLCHFMLMYEPNNSEAKQYAPLIEYMLSQGESSSSSDDDTNDDDSSESGDSTDSSSNEEDEQNDIIASKKVDVSLSNKCPYHK